MNERMPLRARQQIAVKRAIQAVALDLFEASGFAAVTMEEVAAAAKVGVATVYRHFGTKQDLVLWDEYDPLLLKEMSAAIDANVTFDALRAAARTSLEAFYAQDSLRILRRARLVARTPALQAAVLSELAALRAGLARVLQRRGSRLSSLDADVAAGAVVSCLQAAVEAWVRSRGRPRLGKLIDEAFGALSSLSGRRTRTGARPSHGSTSTRPRRSLR